MRVGMIAAAMLLSSAVWADEGVIEQHGSDIQIDARIAVGCTMVLKTSKSYSEIVRYPSNVEISPIDDKTMVLSATGKGLGMITMLDENERIVAVAMVTAIANEPPAKTKRSQPDKGAGEQRDCRTDQPTQTGAAW